MKFVSEEDIQNLMDACEVNDKVFFDIQDKIANEEVAISALLTDDSLKLLNEEEFDLLWFIATIVYGTFTKINDIEIIDPKALEAIEEKNWSLLNAVKGDDFKAKLDTFFKDYPQEDLLAFVEDSLAPDDDLVINPSAREVLFIGTKSIIDALIKHSSFKKDLPFLK